MAANLPRVRGFVADSHGLTSSAQVSLTLSDKDHAPKAVAGTATTDAPFQLREGAGRVPPAADHG
jgi:hypothetical protein